MCVCVEAKKSVRRYLFFLRVLRARVVLQCVCDSGGDREMKGKKTVARRRVFISVCIYRRFILIYVPMYT